MVKMSMKIVVLLIALLTFVGAVVSVNNFGKDSHAGILIYIPFLFLVLPVSLIAVSVYFFRQRKPFISLCIISIIFSCGISLFLSYISNASKTAISEMNSNINANAQKNGVLQQATPPVGYYIPTDNFAPATFKKDRVFYGNDSVIISYKSKTDKTNIVSVIEIAESPIPEKDKERINKVATGFVHNGFPGMIRQSQNMTDGANYNVPNKTGHTTYVLSWVVNGKLITISANNVPEADFNAEKMKAMLGELRRVE